MSLERSAQRESECDFPGCTERFDVTPGAHVATIRDGEIVAFCRKHVELLLNHDVNLRTLGPVRDEYRVLHGIPQEPTPAQLRARQEQAFIASLK